MGASSFADADQLKEGHHAPQQAASVAACIVSRSDDRPNVAAVRTDSSNSCIYFPNAFSIQGVRDRMGFSYAPSVQVRSGVERATLVRRTYGLVFLSVIVTMLGVAFASTQPALLQSVVRHPFLTFLAMFAPLFMVMRDPRTFPKNIILTFLFTFIEGIYIAPFLLFAESRSPGVVGQAGLLTLCAFGALTLFTVASRRDFSAWGSFFFVGLIVLLVTSLLNSFVFHSAVGGMWIAAGGVLVFAGLLVFDTWRIMRSGQLGPDDYALAAVSIYLDLLNMFMFILSLLGGNRRN